MIGLRNFFAGTYVWLLCLNASQAANIPNGESTSCVPGKPAPETVLACTKIISLPDLPTASLREAHLIRGNAYWAASEWPLATADYEAAQKISWSPDVSTALGGLYVNLGRSDDAIKEYTKIIDAGAGTGLIYNARGAAFQNAGKYDESIADFNRAIDLMPKLLVAVNNRAAAYAKKGDYKSAIKDIDAVLAASPDQSIALVNRCMFLERDGHFDQARPVCEHALHVDPDNYFVVLGVGQVYYEQGRFADTVQYCDYSLRLQPNNPRALYTRGMAKNKLGDLAGGQVDITAAAQIQPDIVAFMAKGGMK